MKRIKSIIATILALVLLFSLTGCGEIKKAETAVNGMFTAFKNTDIEAAAKYVDVDEINASEDSSDSISTELVMKTIFNKLDYKIISSEKVDDTTVKVKTEITVTDMKPVLGEFFTNAMQYAFSTAFSNPQPTEEETNKKMEEMFIESASKEDLATVTNEVDITVVKTENNEWKVKSDDTFADALLGGLITAGEELSKAFENQE
ncbi:MAG: lipoprotein [Monoglobaceae bacterium]